MMPNNSFLAQSFVNRLLSLLLIFYLFDSLHTHTTCVRAQETQGTESVEDYVPPTITLNTEVVVSCDFRKSGAFFQFMGMRRDENSDYCYDYILTRYSSIWNCDDNVAQTWSYLIMDPCPNTLNSQPNTTFLYELQTKLSSNNSGSLGAYYDEDWASQGYLFQNSDLSKDSIHIPISLCLNEEVDMIDNGQYCFYSYFKENATVEEPRTLPSGRVRTRPRRGRLDVYENLVSGGRRRRNNRRILSQTAQSQNVDAMSYNDDFTNVASVASDTEDTEDNGSESASDGESEAIGNGGVTYYVCATEKVSVPDVCNEGGR